MLPLPEPVGGGKVTEIRGFINIEEDDLPMVLAYMLNAFSGKTPFPVLELIGEQGSAKSTTQKIIRRLIDPCEALVRGMPKSSEDFFVAAANNYIVSLDNVSHLDQEKQDILCQISTGSGFAKRKNYADWEKTSIKVGRPILLSGIGNVATNGDLVDRTITLELPNIDPSKRRMEGELESAFLERQPYLLGALLDLMAKTLQILPSVQLEKPPRLADFARLGEAMCRAGGFGDFCKMLGKKRKVAALVAVESSPAASAILKFARERESFDGTVQDLFIEVSGPLFRNEGETWVRSAKGFSDAIRRAKPELARLGVDINWGAKSNRGKLIGLRYRDPSKQPSQPSRSSPSQPPRGSFA